MTNFVTKNDQIKLILHDKNVQNVLKEMSQNGLNCNKDYIFHSSIYYDVLINTLISSVYNSLHV